MRLRSPSAITFPLLLLNLSLSASLKHILMGNSWGPLPVPVCRGLFLMARIALFQQITAPSSNSGKIWRLLSHLWLLLVNTRKQILLSVFWVWWMESQQLLKLTTVSNFRQLDKKLPFLRRKCCSEGGGCFQWWLQHLLHLQYVNSKCENFLRLVQALDVRVQIQVTALWARMNAR